MEVVYERGDPPQLRAHELTIEKLVHEGEIVAQCLLIKLAIEVPFEDVHACGHKMEDGGHVGIVSGDGDHEQVSSPLEHERGSINQLNGCCRSSLLGSNNLQTSGGDIMTPEITIPCNTGRARASNRQHQTLTLSRNWFAALTDTSSLKRRDSNPTWAAKRGVGGIE